jgi:predicted permease
MLAKSRGFTAVALITLMLGVGATTSVFSLMDALLLRPLPVPHANRLLAVAYQRSDSDAKSYFFCAPFIRGLEQQTKVFRNVAAYSDRPLPVRQSNSNVLVPGAIVSGEYFQTLGVNPLLGRYLTPQDDRKGGGPGGFGVVISYSLWRDWFHRSPHVIGKTLVISNHPFTIVGVMPKSFIGADPTARPQIYAPLWSEPVIDAPFDMISGGIHDWWLTVFARRRAGMSPAKTNAALAAVSDAALRSQINDPDWLKDALKNHFRFLAKPASEGFSYLQLQFRKPLITVFVLCIAMLLLACLNLASLLVARAAARERELATRLAIGASRARLIQQLMVESLLIAVAGSGLGLLASPLLSHALAALLVGTSPDTVLDARIDIRVLAFSALTAFLATMLIGLLPALRATSKSLNEQIKGGVHASSSRSRGRILLRPLMGLEVGLGLIIVVGAGLLTTSLVRLYTTGLGFNPHGLINLRLDTQPIPIEGQALIRWYHDYADALQHQPGVASVSYEEITPLGSGSAQYDYSKTPKGDTTQVYENDIAPHYFRTMGIPLLAGRDFRWNDTPGTGQKIILNAKAAKLFFPEQIALGQHIYEGKQAFEVIGVVANAKYDYIRHPDPPTAYVPISQLDFKKFSFTAVVRARGPKAPVAIAARQLMARMAPEAPAPIMTTMEQVLNNSIRTERMMAMLSLFFALCALLITGVGLYGTLAYITTQRTSEIGIRMALGAQRWQVVRLVLMENVWITAAGTVAGLAVALLFAKLLASFLYQISPTDPWVLLASALLLALVAGLASLAPAVRAARIDPMNAIRCE